ncbi:MAG TPA: hypothetical protein VM925_02335 [Labilithrix sp.]|nr:hypothetical protein [Labilithrix sp.]
MSFFSVGVRAEETAPAAREQTAVDSALKRDTTPVTLTTTVSSVTETAGPTRASGGPIETKSAGLGVVAGSTKAQLNAGAGSATALAAPQLAGAVVRPAARPQRGRRAASKGDDPQRAILEAMNATFASCLSAADAAVDGAALLNASITQTGDVAAVATVTPGGVSPKAAACFREALTHAKFAPVAAPAVIQVRLAPRELRALPPPAAVPQN